MREKKFAIITSSDKKYGDFLINHWLKSLAKNIDRDSVDIIVLDYGLSEKQKKDLLEKKVIIIKCVRDGHVVNLRFRDMRKLLVGKKYLQVLSADGGDIVFYDNIMPVFYMSPDTFRGVREGAVDLIFIRLCLNKINFNKDIRKKLIDTLKEKPTINGGFIVAPRRKFIELCEFVDKSLTDKSVFGMDQFLVTYYLESQKFSELDESFNFIPAISKRRLFIKNGHYSLTNGKRIAVLHNTGGNNFMRLITNFGYGKQFSKINWTKYFIWRGYRKIIGSRFFRFFLSKLL